MSAGVRPRRVVAAVLLRLVVAWLFVWCYPAGDGVRVGRVRGSGGGALCWEVEPSR